MANSLTNFLNKLNKQATTKLQNVENIDNTTGTNNVQNATKGKKSTEVGRNFTPTVNGNVGGNISTKLKNNQSTYDRVADDSSKKSQELLGKVANKVKEPVNATKELFSAIGDSINKEKQEKAQNAFNKRSENWNSASEEDRLIAMGNDVEKNLNKATMDYQSLKNMVDMSKPETISEETKAKLTELEGNLNYWKNINELREDYGALNEYDRLTKEGTKEEIDSFVETMSHEDDNMAQRAVNAGKHLLVETANIIPTAIDQTRGIGNYNYAQEQISQLDNLFKSGKIDEEYYKENLKYWKDYIDEYSATNKDNLSQKIKSFSNQIQQNTYYGANELESFMLEAGESTAQFLLHYAIGQGIASMVGGSADFVNLAKSALGEEAKGWSIEALAQYGANIAKQQMAMTGAEIATGSMSLVSATARTDELLKQGVDPQTAVNNGLLTGFTSYLTEKVGMDNFVNKVVGGAGEKILGHLINSIGTQALAEGSEELVEGLIDPLIDSYTMGVPYEVDGNELLMSFLLGATSGGIMAVGGTAIGQHRLIVNNRQQFEKLNNEIKYLNSIKSSMSTTQQIEADYWIRVGTNALTDYTNKSKSLGVTFASDIQETTNALQDEKTIIDSLVPNFNEEIDFDQKLNDARNTVISVSQDLLNQKGLNMNSEQYYNLSKETRNKIDNFANNLTDEQRANTIFDYEKIVKEDGKFLYAKDDINARYDGFYDPETGKTIINPLGNRTMESTFVHETLHSLENTYAYKKITDLVDKIFNDKNEVKTFKDNIADLYKKAGKALDEKTLNSEYYARRVQDLIGNEDFLKQLNNYDSNVFNRIFTDLMSKFKGEDSLINQLQNTFAKVYNEAQRTTSNGETQNANVERKYDYDSLVNNDEVNSKIKDLTISKLSKGKKSTSDYYNASVNQANAMNLQMFNTSGNLGYFVETADGDKVKCVRRGVTHISGRTINRNLKSVVIENTPKLLSNSIKLNEYFDTTRGLFGNAYYTSFNYNGKEYIARFLANKYNNIEKIECELALHSSFANIKTDDTATKTLNISSVSNNISSLIEKVNNTVFKDDLSMDVLKRLNGNNYTRNAGHKLNVLYSISELEDKAIQEFGTTTNPYKAGYLMPSGKMLDLSEGQNRRTQDHRTVGVLFDNLDYGRDGMSAGMIQFMNQGNIRLQPEGYGVDISNVVEPTPEQYSSLYDYIANFRNDGFVLDVSDADGYNVFSMEYEPGTSTRQIINDIKNYFADGTIPEETGLNPVEREMARQFFGDRVQYSLTADVGMENLRKAVEEDGKTQYADVYNELANRRLQANQMLDGTLLKEDGSRYNYDEIYEQTGWLFDKNDNILKGEFYDDDTINKIYDWVNKQKGRGSDFRNDSKNTPLANVIGEDNLLFTMYPDFKKAYIFATNNISKTWGSMTPTLPDDVNGYMRGDVRRLRIGKVKKGYVADPNGKYTNVRTGERVSKKAVSLTEGEIKNTIAHELQHGIQLYEHFLYGTPGTAYEDRPGEIESRWVGERQEDFGLRWKTPNGIVDLDDETRIQGEGQVLDGRTEEGTTSETSGQTPNGQLEPSNELEDSTREDGGDFVGENPITPEESENNLLDSQEEGSDEKVAKIMEEMPQPESFFSKLKRAFKIARHEFVDHLDAVDELARKAKNKTLKGKADYAMLASNIADEALLNGHHDLKTGAKIDDGLDKIIQKVGDNKAEFSEYLYHWRNIDTTSMNERFSERYEEGVKKLAEQIYYSDANNPGGGTITKEQALEQARKEFTLNKYVFGKSIGLKESRARVAELEQLHPEFAELAQGVWDYFNNDLQVLVDYGVITNADMQTYLEETPHYVPIKRNVDVQRAGKSSLDANKAIMQFKGSDIDLLPFDYSAIKHTEAVYRSALNNNLYTEIIKTIDPNMIKKIDNQTNGLNSLDELLNGSVEDTINSLDNENNTVVGLDGDNNLYAYYKGNRLTLGVNDELAESLKPRKNPFNMPDLNPLMTFSEFRRNLITGWNPMFMFTNAIKDIQDAGFNTKYPTKFAGCYAEAWAQILGNGQLKNLYIKNGGRSGYITELGNPKLKGKNVFAKALNTVVDINEAVEMAPRLAEFIASIKSGESIETAMYNASEVTTNFKRGGDTAKYINRNGSAFLNASIQGFAKQVRNIQDAKDGGAKGILTYMAKLTLTAGLPLFILNHLMWKDDDEYDELSDYVKQNYYVIKKYGDGKFIKIPKGRISAFFQTVMQDTKSTVQGKAKVWDSLMDVIDSFANNIAPNSVTENSIIAPLVQAYTNKTWYGDDLVPTRLQDLPEEEQYDETTDELSIWLGKKLGASPYKINYVLDQYSGAIGDIGLPIITVQATNGIDNKVLSGLASPWLDKFTTDSTMKNQNVSNFYDLKTELSIASKGANATEEQKLSSKFMNSVNSQVSDLYAQKRQAQLDKSLSNKDKYDKVRDIQRQIDDMVNYALTNYDQIDINNNYASVGGVYYTKSDDGWNKLNAKQMEQLRDAVSNGIKEEDYFDYKENAGTKQAERVKYLEESDLSQSQKEYLYGLGGYKTTYAEAYAKVMNGGSVKRSTTSKNKASSRKKTAKNTTIKVTAKPITFGSKNASNSTYNKDRNYINAYSKTFGNNSKAKSTDSNLQTCPRCGRRVNPVNGYCPVCGYKMN